MNILMITPGIDPNNDVFGAYHSLMTRLASKVDKLVIITLRPTDVVPSNVKVISIKANNRLSKFTKLNKAIFSALRKERIDIIFCHMYLEFSLTAYPYSRIFGKPITTWYEHSSTPIKLKLVNLLVDKIFSASRHGFRLKSKKSIVLGQCIDTSIFEPSKNKNAKEILSVSRISRSKNLELIIKAIAKLSDKNVRLTIVGSPVDDSGQRYMDELKDLVKKLGLENNVVFAGHIDHKDVAKYYDKASIFINTSKTGSLDKTGIEAMSSGLLLLASNPAYSEVLENYKNKDLLICDENNLADKLSALLKLSIKRREEITNDLRQIAVENHSLDHMTSKLIDEFNVLLKTS